VSSIAPIDADAPSVVWAPASSLTPPPTAKRSRSRRWLTSSRDALLWILRLPRCAIALLGLTFYSGAIHFSCRGTASGLGCSVRKSGPAWRLGGEQYACAPTRLRGRRGQARLPSRRRQLLRQLHE